MHSRRRIGHLGLAAVLVVLPAGCQEPPAEKPEPRDPIEQRPALRTGWDGGGSLTFESISFGGKPPVGPFEAGDFVWHDEKHWLVLSVAEYPGKPKGPVALVIARVPAGSKPETHNVSQGQTIFTIQTDFDSNHPGRAEVVWALRQGLLQSMQISGKEYDLEQGRVFLVDAAGKHTSVYQINAGLGGTFRAPGPNFEQLGGEIESLLQTDARVKKFWMGADPDAEDS
jgi:hypothetical protein